ncbi:MAG: 4-alpha-glucanotransferase [Elusimicrobia bacterium]|nr:4-alpha-glucanotransferase [Elusimicrobiota bacterium]
MAKDAQEQYGGEKASKTKRFLLKPLRAASSVLASWVLPVLTVFALPQRMFADPVQAVLHAPPAISSPVKARDSSWWRDRSARHTAASVPVFALRRSQNDPGVGKYTDLARKDVLSKQGVDVVLLLPHFATAEESPYSAASLYAANEDNLDWSQVPEVSGDAALLAKLRAGTTEKVDYAAVRAREGAVGAQAWRKFKSEQLDQNTARAKAYQEFVAKNASWLNDYAEFMTLSKLIGKPSLEWSADDVAKARASAGFAEAVDVRRYSQWLVSGQLQEAIKTVHAAGGRLMFDIPMFRGKDSVDAWKHPEYFTDLKTRNPGIINQWLHEDWMDLALWNWTKLKADGYRMALDPYRHWLDLGFDGARVDALHFAYNFGNGQLASGDEPGDDYVRALSGVLRERSAFPLAEAFEGKDEAARRFGFVTVKGDWKVFSSHDDPRLPDFMSRLLQLRREPPSGNNAAFTAYTLGDEWGDTVPVKEMKDGHSLWRYRIPMPTDPDYKARVRADAGSQLRALKAVKDGDVWREAGAVKSVLQKAANTFIKHDNGGVQIWAAAMDWFQEEWGRDTFISLPGLLISSGRLSEAKENLRGFAKHEKDGLLPNRIPGGDRAAEYNTADAPMWFIQAVKKVVEAGGDQAFAAEMLPVMRRILAKYAEGTGYDRYGRFNKIYMDSDGLVVSPAQATWMDADPEGRDKPVTPRNGKTVEINALWYANLRFIAALERKTGDAKDAKGLDELADKVKQNYNDKFYFTTEDNAKQWGGDGGALRDVIEGDPHSEAIRPNMLFAVSHGGDLLSPERQKSVVLAATKDLLTSFGLRTLSYRDSHYREVYETWKPPLEKDQAYHQGTAWPWLIGSYVDALSTVRRSQGRSDAEIRAEVRGLLRPLAQFLVEHPEASLPEVFDGGKPIDALARFSLDDPKGLADVFNGNLPWQNPGGTHSQAWSVGETTRALAEHGTAPASPAPKRDR